MTHAALLAALLPLALGAPQGSADDAAKLVPPGTFLTLRVESTESLHAFASKIAAAGGDDVPEDASTLLGEMDIPGDSSLIDVSRPFYLALALNGMATQTTFVVPVTDAAAFSASLADDASMHTATVGGYVGVSQLPGFAALAEPNPLLGQLRPGMASARLDLKTLIQTFRPMVEMGMSQLEMMMDQAALEMEQDAPMDMAAILEFYVEGIWAFLDSADQLDFTLEYDGRVALARSWLTTLPDSPMASVGGEESFDMWPAARWIDPEASFSMALACDMAATMERWGPMMDLLFDAYPPELADQMRAMMDAYEPIWPLLGNHLAFSGDFGPGGMRGSYTVLCEDSAALSTTMTGLFGELVAANTEFLSMTPPEEVEVAGAPATRSKLTMDFMGMTDGMLEGEELDGDELEMMQTMMDAIYGRDGLMMVWQALEGRLAMALGGDDAFAAETLATGPRDDATLPMELRTAVDSVSGGSMGIVYRIDYGRIFSDLGPVFAEMGVEELGALGESGASLPLTFWMGVGQSTWSGGVGMDLDQLVAFSTTMRDAAGAELIEESDD